MDWLQFIAAVIGHLAWPLVIVALFIILRKHMGALADRLLEFSFGGAKVTFDKILQKGADIIDQSPQIEPPKPPSELQPKRPSKVPSQSKILVNAVRRLKEYRDRQELWGFQITSGLEEVDKVLFEIGDLIGIDAADPLSVMHVLVTKKLISNDLWKLYDTLRDARNLLAHSQTLPDKREASEYVRQTAFLKAGLEALRRTLTPVAETSVEE